MRYREHEPLSCLKPYLKCYWTLQFSTPPSAPSGQRILAENFEFTFNLAAPVEIVNGEGQTKRISTSGITGPMSRPMRLKPTGALNLFGICFRPGGGYPFFKYPTHELADQFPDVGDLWGTSGREFVENIQYDCTTIQSRIDAINAYLSKCLTTNHCEDDITRAAIAIVENLKGRITISRLAQHLGISRRHLTRKFKERIGVTPKQLCRNIRFKHAYKLLEIAPDPHWADVAIACGYYDQSHLINEFKYFTGSSPEAYFGSSTQRTPDFFTANF